MSNLTSLEYSCDTVTVIRWRNFKTEIFVYLVVALWSEITTIGVGVISELPDRILFCICQQ